MITTVQHVIDCSNQHTHVAIASERRMLAAVGTLGTLVGLACVRRSVPRGTTMQRGTTMHLRGTLCWQAHATAAFERQFARSQRQAANLSRHPQFVSVFQATVVVRSTAFTQANAPHFLRAAPGVVGAACADTGSSHSRARTARLSQDARRASAEGCTKRSSSRPTQRWRRSCVSPRRDDASVLGGSEVAADDLTLAPWRSAACFTPFNDAWSSRAATSPAAADGVTAVDA